MNTIGANEELFSSLGLSRQDEEKRKDILGMADFMNLMVTELTHQDPFKPMDNTELASQISQFATVSGIDQLNSSFSSLSSSLLSDQSLLAANLVGREVLVPLNTGYLQPAGSFGGVIGLESSASNVFVRITDASGVLVKEIPLGNLPKGESHFSWDGITDSGLAAAPGIYHVNAKAKVNDEAVTPYVLLDATVGSVSIGAPGQGIALNLEGLGTISFDDVAEIH